MAGPLRFRSCLKPRAAGLALMVLGALLAPSTALQAQPIRQRGHLLSCPDPSVVRAHVGAYRYYLVCTSDYAVNALPIRGSNNLLNWHPVGYVFPHGHQPWWALSSPVGRYWAPDIHRIEGRWVVYFAAQFNPRVMPLRFDDGARIEEGTFVVGVAWSASLHGPWHTRLLHYRGQFNRVNREQESYGGVIDPSTVYDPLTHQRYLFWAEQPSSIWAGVLSPNGLYLRPSIHQVLTPRAGWECRTPNGNCVVEGPEEYFHDGLVYLFYSGASTWTGTYAVGVAVSWNPMGIPFRSFSTRPDLHSGGGYIGPGGTSSPVVGPNGRDYIFYHVEIRPNRDHISAERYLFMSRIAWRRNGYYPLIGVGYPNWRLASSNGVPPTRRF
jgi:beta-xylosidase